jgi:hypothetical protein
VVKDRSGERFVFEKYGLITHVKYVLVSVISNLNHYVPLVDNNLSSIGKTHPPSKDRLCLDKQSAEMLELALSVPS